MADDTTIPTVPAANLPPEPEPMPATPAITETPVVPPPPLPTLDPTPVPTPAPAVPNAESVVESLLETKNPESVVVPPVSTQHHNAGPKKSSKGPLIALIALLLLVLPVSVYFISQQNQQLADTRSRAWGTGYSNCSGATDDNPRGTCPVGQVCDCMDGEMCTEKQCMPDSDKRASCERQGRSYCENMNGGAMTCCYPGYVCWDGGAGCIWAGDDNPDDDTGDDDTTATPTPTTGVNPVCQNIKLYKNGTQVTDLTTLRAGDDVVLAVKGNLAPTKAHFRVNGGAWNETTTKNASDEFTWSYTIADGVTDFVIEGEVFTNGAWH